MVGGFAKRYVTAPDGTRWTVGRRWLARRPRYRGFRFGVDPYEPDYEPPASPRTDRKPIRKPHPRSRVMPNPYRDNPASTRSDGSGWFWWSGRSRGGSGGVSAGRRGSPRSPGSRTSGGPSRGGGLRGLSLGGGARSGGGGSRGGGSKGGGRGKGGGGAGAGLAGLGSVLAKAGKYLLIGAAIIAAVLFLVFVGIPAVLFLSEYLLFWVLAVGSAVFRGISGRPWIIQARRSGYEDADHAYRVTGWRSSTGVLHELAERLRRGEDLTAIDDAEPVELIDH